MRNLVLVSRGAEVGRGIYDTKTNSIKVCMFPPIEGESNRGNNIAYLVDTLEKIKEKYPNEPVTVHGLNLLVNSVFRLQSIKKTLASAGVEDIEKVIEVFLENMDVTETEKEAWKAFVEIDSEMSLKFRKLPNLAAVEEMVKSASNFEKNLGKTIQSAWAKVPARDIMEIEDDEAV